MEGLTTAFEYQIGTERVDVAGRPRTLWMAAQTTRAQDSEVVRGVSRCDLRLRGIAMRAGQHPSSLIKAFTTTLEIQEVLQEDDCDCAARISLR